MKKTGGHDDATETRTHRCIPAVTAASPKPARTATAHSTKRKRKKREHSTNRDTAATKIPRKEDRRVSQNNPTDVGALSSLTRHAQAAPYGET
jgi:hypothetical protein